ncbi:MAG: topoisomerase DNA-binding C4 zinc finger domain-containing protein [Bacteroidales bacterium]|nr:topoisomerase DNA-binding C4 zinc finger domain-containing protein [Candidatus Latescibacterota bacterium]
MNKPIKKCYNCDALMVLRTGPYGQFWGCSRFPKCDYTWKPRKTLYWDTPHWGNDWDETHEDYFGMDGGHRF